MNAGAEADLVRLRADIGLAVSKFSVLTMVLTERDERARCLAWVRWWEDRGCRWSEWGGVGAGIESGRWPKEKGDE